MKARDKRKKVIRRAKKAAVKKAAPKPGELKAMICLILDRSGSMGGRETDVINGVNTFVAEQKKLPTPASIAFVRFDSESTERFRPMTKLADCKPLVKDDYQPRGGTPLLDAVGKTIVQLDEDWKAEKPDRCIVVIVTDGEENASHEYTKEKIQALVKARQDGGKWAFIYLGANVDSFAEARALGVNTANVANYQPTAAGIHATYMVSSHAVGAMRSTGSVVSATLGGNINEDGSVTPTTTGAWTPPA